MLIPKESVVIVLILTDGSSNSLINYHVQANLVFFTHINTNLVFLTIM